VQLYVQHARKFQVRIKKIRVKFSDKEEGIIKNKSYIGGFHMASFKVVVSDPKEARAYQIDVKDAQANSLIGKSIGDVVDGSFCGLAGYKVKITGGCDGSGFVMKPDLPGPRRQRILMAVGVGYTPKLPGQRRRKMVRGKEIAPDVVQVNAKVVEYGSKSIKALLGLETSAGAPATE
jgi:small subunit ribosomal protein S6e